MTKSMVADRRLLRSPIPTLLQKSISRRTSRMAIRLPETGIKDWSKLHTFEERNDATVATGGNAPAL